MNVAVVDTNAVIVAVNIVADDYVCGPNEVQAASAAYVGGDLLGGIFYLPQPFPSWLRQMGHWVAPVPIPQGATGLTHRWDEDTLSWVEVTA